MPIPRRVFLAEGLAGAAWLPQAGAAAGAAAPGVAPWETPDGRASDAVFVRRVHLAVAGRIPTPDEARAYVASADPCKKEKLVDALLASETCNDYWTMRFCDLLRVKSEFPVNLWPNAVYVYHRRIRAFVAANEPWDRFARALLAATGSNFRVPEANFLRAVSMRTPEGLSAAASLTFLGEESEAYADYFRGVSFKPTREWKEEIVCVDAARGPTPAAFADRLLGAERRRFEEAFVRRVSAWFTCEDSPVRGETPAFWARLFGASGELRLKSLLRALALSEPFARGSVTGGFPCHRLCAEVLEDALCDITGAPRAYQSIAPEPFTFLPAKRRSVAIEDGSITGSFLLLFGRPARDSGRADERNDAVTTAQRLHLFNSAQLYRALAKVTDNRAFRNRPLRAILEDLYLRILARTPTEDEAARLRAWQEALPRKGAARWRFVKDLAWCLVNTREFLYQH